MVLVPSPLLLGDLEGSSRKALVEVKDLEVNPLEKDELNPGKKKVVLKFFLTKGSYATMVIKKLLN